MEVDCENLINNDIPHSVMSESVVNDAEITESTLDQNEEDNNIKEDENNDLGVSKSAVNDAEITDSTIERNEENDTEDINADGDENADNIDDPVDSNLSGPNIQVQRITRLPIARVKNIIKFDDDVKATSLESTFLITKATELFIGDFVKEVYQCTLASKKKTISKRDIDTAIFSRDYFMFLDGALD